MSVHRQLIEDRFEVVEELADDGWESIFRARHREMGDECLVKVVRRPGPAEPGRAESGPLDETLPWLTRLSHPGLAQLYDVRRVPPHHVIVEMEFVPGTSLDALVADAVARDEDAPLPVATVFEVLDGCLEAVEWLHGQGWHHGALSPAKFRLRRGEDGEMSVRLVDPGVGRLFGAGERTTAGGLLARKLRYAAPERFLGDLPEPTAAVDVYALGLVAYELFTGRHPILGESATALAAGHLMHPPLSFSESDPGGRLSDELRSLLQETLAKQPERRPESVDDLRRRLRAAAEVEARKGLGKKTGLGEQTGLGAKTGLGEDDVLALLLDDSRTGDPKDGSPRSEKGDLVDVRPPGPSIETVDMRAARDEAKRREGKVKVRRLVKDAGQEVDRSNYTAALDLLREGLRYAPEEPKLVALLRQVESAARRQKAESQRRRKIDEEVRAVEALLERGEEAAARERLLDIEDRLGADPRLAALLRTLEPADEETGDGDERRPKESPGDARRRAEDLVSKARRLSRSEDFSGAREALRQAVALDPEHREARTLSESVEALVELGKQEGRRRQEVQEAEAEIRALLERGDPGAAMAKLNRAVARHGDLPELQSLRYDVARVFLEADAVYEAGDATHVPRPEARPEAGRSSPERRPSSSAPSTRPAAPDRAPPPIPPAEAQARPAQARPAEVRPAEVQDAAPSNDPPRTVFELELAGLGDEDSPPPPGTDAVPEPTTPAGPNPWLDLRDPRGFVLLLVLLALVAFLGHWLATRDQGDAAPDGPPGIETEDIETEDIETEDIPAPQILGAVPAPPGWLPTSPEIAPESSPQTSQPSRKASTRFVPPGLSAVSELAVSELAVSEFVASSRASISSGNSDSSRRIRSKPAAR